MFSTMSSLPYWNSDWQFLTFVTCVRVLEIAMAITMIYALSRTNMKLRKVLGRFSRTWWMADSRSMKSADNGYTDSWKSTPSLSSAGSLKHVITWTGHARLWYNLGLIDSSVTASRCPSSSLIIWDNSALFTSYFESPRLLFFSHAHQRARNVRLFELWKLIKISL